jgi:hypothetical protein
LRQVERHPRASSDGASEEDLCLPLAPGWHAAIFAFT